ncbi:heme biosynthesis HemY N-terminal domain-containing protein [Amphritea pacifica]|uniref:heme biosynthesis HemY N-terminal domain-containing protein n=1 Tax=Amphritea pacifica TaxID=2811233 RepID=UPI0019642A96|nr:heme biosynthesis HemY N-terminal domain-containing protein [Amphritea pacifica]MBN1006696.1 tetratricopeptide repeat protein [Amphritea pacifica]
MKRIFILLLAFMFAGTWIGQKMIQDSGYTLFAYGQTTVEMSLWVFLVLIVALFFALHWGINLFKRSLKSGAHLRLWSGSRKSRIAHDKTLKGLIALSEGNWWKAQRLLSISADNADLPLINYLAAAHAAQEQGDEKACDELLQKARASTPEAEITVGINQAQTQLARGQLEPSLATLLSLRQKAPKNTYVMKLLRKVYIQLNDWQSLQALIPELRKNKALKPEKLLQTEQLCYQKLLELSIVLPDSASSDEKRKALAETWHNMPGQLTQDDQLARHYTRLLVSIGAEAKAEPVIRDLIKRNWDNELVNLYGRIEGDNPKKQLETARSWLKDDPLNPDLLLTLGRLSQRNQHWGKAITYFEQSLEQSPRAETLSELARLLKNLGETDKMRQLMEKHLGVIGGGLPALPLPQKGTKLTAL